MPHALDVCGPSYMAAPEPLHLDPDLSSREVSEPKRHSTHDRAVKTRFLPSLLHRSRSESLCALIQAVNL